MRLDDTKPLTSSGYHQKQSVDAGTCSANEDDLKTDEANSDSKTSEDGTVQHQLNKNEQKIAQNLLNTPCNHYLLQLDSKQTLNTQKLLPAATTYQCSITQNDETLLKLSLRKHTDLFLSGSHIDRNGVYAIMQKLFAVKDTIITTATRELFHRVCRQYKHDPAVALEDKVDDDDDRKDDEDEDEHETKEFDIGMFGHCPLEERLERFVKNHNKDRPVDEHLNIYTLQHIFYNYGFSNAAYFRERAHRKEFISVLQANAILVGTACKLWNALSPPRQAPLKQDCVHSPEIGTYSYIPSPNGHVMPMPYENDVDDEMDEQDEEEADLDEEGAFVDGGASSGGEEDDEGDYDDQDDEDEDDDEGDIELEEGSVLSVQSDW